MPAVKTLYQLCQEKGAAMLLEQYWRRKCWFNQSSKGNPFSLLPARCVEDLLRTALQVHKVLFDERRSISELQLRPLLTSGRIVDFELVDVELYISNLESILLHLSRFSQFLKSVHIRLRLLNGYFLHWKERYVDPTYSVLETSAFEQLLRSSPNLERMRTNLPFDLAELKSTPKLRSLKMDFIPHRVDCLGGLGLNDLQSVEIGAHVFSTRDAAYILHHCPKLRSLNGNVIGALRDLHSRELDEGGHVSRRYELETITLLELSEHALKLVANTCPDISTLHLLHSKKITQSQELHFLRDWKSLKSLHANPRYCLATKWPSFSGTILPVLRVVGHRLTEVSFSAADVDFQVLAAECPRVALLTVTLKKDVVSDRGDKSSGFPDLERLHVTCVNSSLQASSVQILLAQCTRLRHLYLKNVTSLNDSLVAKILSQNPLNCLKSVTLCGCSLTKAWEALVMGSCPRLEAVNHKLLASEGSTLQ